MSDALTTQFNTAAEKVICLREYFARARELRSESFTGREKLMKLATLPATLAVAAYNSFDTLGSKAQDDLIAANKDGSAGMYMGPGGPFVSVATFRLLAMGNPAKWISASLRAKMEAASAQALHEVKDYAPDVVSGKLKPIKPRGF